ncbi:hypothetical protein M8J77_016596 [Diaphorina citri]|nr:hypothetical protein M8J77_016596 [Diaphorina citri]
MMEDLISRFKNKFDLHETLSGKCNNPDDVYGIPDERKLFTKSWVTKHLELFRTIVDNELIAEAQRTETKERSLDKLMFRLKGVPSMNENPDRLKAIISTRPGNSNHRNKILGQDKSCSKEKLKPKIRLGETDSGLPGTTVLTNTSMKKCLEGPACDSCQSLLKSLCRGCHYKIQTQGQCYFFSAFKKNKSKKLQNKQPPVEQLCSKCKVIVQEEHEPNICKALQSNHDLPKWSRQRKYILYNRKKSLCRKPERKILDKPSKLDRAKDNKEQSKRRKTRNRYTSCFYRSNQGDKHLGETLLHCQPSILSKLKSENWKIKSKSIKSCVKTFNASTQSRAADITGNRKKTKHCSRRSSFVNNEISPSPQVTRETCPSKRRPKVSAKTTDGRLSCLRKICPCDAACGFCEDFRFNWRFLTTLPKNWGKLVQEKCENEGACPD